MNKEVIQELAKQLKDVGASLKDLGTEGFTTYVEWFVRKCYACAVANVIGIVLTLVGCLLFIKLGNYLKTKYKDDGSYYAGIHWSGYAPAMICGIICMCFFIDAGCEITKVIAPEYYALTNLLGK